MSTPHPSARVGSKRWSTPLTGLHAGAWILARDLELGDLLLDLLPDVRAIFAKCGGPCRAPALARRDVGAVRLHQRSST
jgi:hypothetical protein